MKDENQHFKITSVQCTYYKPGHLRPILMLKPHYSSKCNCYCCCTSISISTRCL